MTCPAARFISPTAMSITASPSSIPIPASFCAPGAHTARPSPFQESGLETFNNPVHAISLGPEGHLYVCDRKNDRIQVFDAIGRTEPRFVRELGGEGREPIRYYFQRGF